jgi:Fe-S cluster assembly protein SufB
MRRVLTPPRHGGCGRAVALVVNGFCKDVLQALPMEFAMEAQSLVAISLEGSVG